MSEPTVTPWPGDTLPEAAELEGVLRKEGLSPQWWENMPHDRYAMHEHTYHKVLYCLRGSIAFFAPDSCGRLELHPGDRLDLPPHTRHSALVGAEGVRCVEAPRWD